MVAIRLAVRCLVAVRQAVMMILEAVRQHYRTLWGEPSRNARFTLGGSNFEIYKWNADATSEGVNLYATIGASDRPLREDDPDHRIEMFMGLLPANDDVALPLAMLASNPRREGTDLEHGDTVSFLDPLWKGTNMRSVLLLRPIAEIVPPLKLDDGLHVEFLQAIPIFASELSFKKERGAEALMQRWEVKGVPFWDPDRTPEPA